MKKEQQSMTTMTNSVATDEIYSIGSVFPFDYVPQDEQAELETDPIITQYVVEL